MDLGVGGSSPPAPVVSSSSRRRVDIIVDRSERSAGIACKSSGIRLGAFVDVSRFLLRAKIRLLKFHDPLEIFIYLYVRGNTSSREFFKASTIVGNSYHKPFQLV